MRITFCGAAGTVTGSKYLLEHEGKRVLVDCGLFQGLKQLRLRNWEPFPLHADKIDAVVLTHAHIDHSGYLPALARQGFRGPVFCTEATRDLCGLMLPDSGHLQEEDAFYANRHGFSKHQPALPLYTEQDARKTLKLFRPQGLHEEFEPVPGLHVRFTLAGHILGAASVHVRWDGGSLLFSGYVAKFANYNETYGSLGAAIGFMTWLWLSVTIVLVSGELNAEIEHQTAKDSTEGPPQPLGARGAQMADTVGEAKA